MKLHSEKISFVFPGQGSQIVGMGQDLASQFKICSDIFDQADQILGYKLSKILWEGPQEVLNDTVNTQPALFVHSIAALRLFQAEFPDIKPVFIAGHSLGEISALVASASISFEDGLKLVQRRGELMKIAGEISPGGMAAILGLEVQILDEICSQASDETGQVQIANDNCPGQIVISGNLSALEKAMDLAKDQGARKILPLKVSIAAHSKLMETIIKDFHDTLEKIEGFRDSEVPVISNVMATPIKSTSDLKDDLLAQLTSRVRWTESIQYMQEHGVSIFIELGSGNVLTGLLKRINGTCTGIPYGEWKNVDTLRQEKDVSG
jgi:[acyl-carrier-protein] S-malonyltransferase